MRSRNRAEAERAVEARTGIDVNALSFNLRFIRLLRRFTQVQVARKLRALTGIGCPRRLLAARERGCDGERRRRFDALELYLLSFVSEVPITKLFTQPFSSDEELTDSRNRSAH